jgi:serine/threonine-protein kinase HipA
MRAARVLYKGEVAGILTESDDGTYTFTYDHAWVADPARPAITLTLPKADGPYRSPFLFPFFFHLLPEGVNRQSACRQLRIDPEDDFGLLLHIARADTVGAVTIERINGMP